MPLIDKISNKTAKIGVIGLGYVGLPLVIEFCRAGFSVSGFDVDEQKISLLRQGRSYIKHIAPSTLAEITKGGTKGGTAPDLISSTPKGGTAPDLISAAPPVPPVQNEDNAPLSVPNKKQSSLVFSEVSALPDTSPHSMGDNNRELSPLLKTGSCPPFSPTTDFTLLEEMDCIIICVPTPLNANREPDMKYVFNTSQMIARHLRPGQLIVLESTTYPGTTDGDMREILEAGGLKAGVDFHLAFSPEREDPNNRDFSVRTIPKVVGGYTKGCLAAAVALYDSIVDRTVPVSSTRVAESAKLLENIYRSVNIAMVNELKMLFDRMGIDVWEVIEAAKTKPFGFHAFYPGPGLGGHCIPIDPFYLTWKAREYEFSTRFIELAGAINTAMPDYVVLKVMKALNDHGKALKGSKILILGLAYKANVDDDRESPSYRLLEKLEELGAEVSYNDPYIPEIRMTREHPHLAGRKSAEIGGSFDLILIATAHDEYQGIDFKSLGIPVVDTRNVIPERGGSVYQA